MITAVLSHGEFEQGGIGPFPHLGRATLTRSPEGRQGAVEVAALLEQHAEVERPVGIAAAIGTLKRPLGIAKLTLLLEQHAEIARGRAVATLIRASISSRGPRQVAPLLKRHPEAERPIGIITPIGAPQRVLRTEQLLAPAIQAKSGSRAAIQIIAAHARAAAPKRVHARQQRQQNPGEQYQPESR